MVVPVLLSTGAAVDVVVGAAGATVVGKTSVAVASDGASVA